ncbi:Clavaminate synthase-like protein [Gyrodon lividus]|nr:Clavaminate synthase-like protein [Gyrodon lividus]
MQGLSESNHRIGRDFRSTVLRLLDDVDRDSNPDLALSMDQFISIAYERMPSSERSASYYWRMLYTDACILKVLARAITPDLPEEIAGECISTLDHAIIIAGAATDEDKRDYIVHQIFKQLQSNIPWRLPNQSVFTHKSAPVHQLSTSRNNVRSRASLPPIVTAQKDWSTTPFVLRGHASNWRAMHEPHRWASLPYLFSVAGPGRIVPVEVGDDYRSDDWTQRLLGWDEFLSSLDSEGDSGQHRRHTLYLAQHNLLTQFPQLQEDITIPDITYAYLDSPDFPNYEPPTNVIVNAWLGPKGTISPAHTDPFFNCYVQVVGRKTVWLAPPNIAACMYPYDRSPTGTDKSHNPAANNTNPLLSNTSRVDVFPGTPQAIEASQMAFPLFWKAVPDKALCVTLNPGDLLFFPPGWWHAMRSEDVSFSVSMWF